MRVTVIGDGAERTRTRTRRRKGRSCEENEGAAFPFAPAEGLELKRILR